jgi:hypothetical protein
MSQRTSALNRTTVETSDLTQCWCAFEMLGSTNLVTHHVPEDLCSTEPLLKLHISHSVGVPLKRWEALSRQHIMSQRTSVLNRTTVETSGLTQCWRAFETLGSTNPATHDVPDDLSILYNFRSHTVLAVPHILLSSH